MNYLSPPSSPRASHSYYSPHSRRAGSKYTRGEKCLLFHIVVTIIGILIMSIIYFLHLWHVKHDLKTALKFSRRSGLFGREYVPLGVVFLNTSEARPLCNSLLLRGTWSLVTGQCAAMRSEPDLYEVLPYWTIQYLSKDSGKLVTTEIIRSIPHPHFNIDDLGNNVGLFQHKDSVSTFEFFSQAMPYPIIENDTQLTVEVVGWDWNRKDVRRVLKIMSFQQNSRDYCTEQVSPIIELRPYEFCASLIETADLCYELGALVYVNKTIIGLFSWGEKCPNPSSNFIVITLTNFNFWLKEMISLD